MGRKIYRCVVCEFEQDVTWEDNQSLKNRDIPCGRCYSESWSLVGGVTTKTTNGAFISCDKDKGKEKVNNANI